MALIIEDGSGLQNSQSYVTVAELNAFALARGVDLPATDPEKEALLVSASDFLQTLNFIGRRLTREQALSWPREGVKIDGFAVAKDEIPREVKEAQLQAAVDSLTVPLLATQAAATRGAVLETSVEGAVSIKYAAPASTTQVGSIGPAGASLPRLSAILKPLLSSGGMGINARVLRT